MFEDEAQPFHCEECGSNLFYLFYDDYECAECSALYERIEIDFSKD